ncbi:MAG: hypothetical protein AAGJ46_07755 [Planctomycetota bacterium]
MKLAESPSAAGSSELLTEYTTSRSVGVRVDQPASVLHGVKLLGLTSRNGRRYREEALRRAMPLYEGARVNVNHPPGDPLAPRDYRDRIGVVRNVTLRPGEGLFASLHYNPKHPLAEQLVWDAEHAPENVGFSHNVVAQTSRDGNGLVVDAIQRVRSVDLVADPASTNGLFEQESVDAEQAPRPLDWGRVTLADVELNRPDLLIGIAEQHQAELQELKGDAESFRESEGRLRRRLRAFELLAEHGLPLPGTRQEGGETTGVFFEAVAAAPDEKAMAGLIADRAAALSSAKASRTAVTSREQHSYAAPSSQPPLAESSAFVAAITAP